MQPLRVLEFITPAGFYGAERWVLALANNLDPNRVVCDLAVTEENSGQNLELADHYPRRIGQVHRLSMTGRFDFRVVQKLMTVIRDRDIQVIHTHGYKSDILGLLAAKLTGIRCLSTPHGFSGNVGWKLTAFIKLGTRILRYFDAVAPLSEELVRDMYRFRVPEANVLLILNGVDLSEIDASIKLRNIGSETSESTSKTIGFIGQLIPRKGVSDLLEIFDRLYDADSSLKLVLLGDGRERAALEAQSQAKPSGGAVHFLGFRNDRLEQLKRFDVFVMTSSLEGIPRCLMEAMAARVPVAAYDIPGVDQLVEHRVTGLLAPLGDKEALSDLCREILNNPALGRDLAQAARQRIESEYSARRMASEYEHLFKQLIDGQPISQSATEGDV